MNFIIPFLPYIQIGLSVLLIVAILLQQTSSSAGGAFGGGDSFSSAYHTRRGFEKVLFNATILFAILLTISSFLALTIK
ncbi:MAG: preprotein translocase subunit SecG [Candidatus Paceibacterota bacterium]